jgi:hypothetical protein
MRALGARAESNWIERDNPPDLVRTKPLQPQYFTAPIDNSKIYLALEMPK